MHRYALMDFFVLGRKCAFLLGISLLVYLITLFVIPRACYIHPQLHPR